MNWSQFQGGRKQFRSKVKGQWGRLTDDELDQIAGKRDILTDKIQRKYGIAQEETEKQVKDWKSRARPGRRSTADRWSHFMVLA